MYTTQQLNHDQLPNSSETYIDGLDPILIHTEAYVQASFCMRLAACMGCQPAGSCVLSAIQTCCRESTVR
jgi:hypothetical protein